MKIGVPKEIKNNEFRAGLVPESVLQLKRDGHEIYVETNLGVGIGLTDEDYKNAGAIILESLEEVFEKSEMIIKVKEPQKREVNCLKPHHILYTYLHLSADKELTLGLMNSGATCIAYETIQLSDNSLPLLFPMSEVAGRMATIVGTEYLQKNKGGKGILLGGVTGTKRANVTILGGGVAGISALKMATGLEANVNILDVDINKLRYIDDIYGSKVTTLYSNIGNIENTCLESDLIIGTVLIPGAKAPHLVSKELVNRLEKGTVLVDVAIDQGGCFETSKPTTHENPIYNINDVVHYCVTNMPGAYPRTSSYALNNATLKYARILANQGVKEAISNYKELYLGVNVADGKLVYKQVADDLNLPYTKL